VKADNGYLKKGQIVQDYTGEKFKVLELRKGGVLVRDLQTRNEEYVVPTEEIKKGCIIMKSGA